MKSAAFLFPGQGAQVLGMAVDLVEACPQARAVFDRGREILGFDVLGVCRDGPADELNSTRVSQPAIFLDSMALLEVLGDRAGACGTGYGTGLAAAAAAGLSLGEYSALVFAGSLTCDDALNLVARRGEYMQEACDAEKGSMASILGLDAPRVEEEVDRATAARHRVGIANYNSPAQTVISGSEESVAETAERLKAAGARRVVMLPVAGAYHSSLMGEATRKMKPLLEEVPIQPPRIHFYGNYEGGAVSDPEAIRRGLILQIENPVRWHQSMQALLATGVRSALEVGPGRVIQGLLRGIERAFEVRSIADLETLDNVEVVPV